MVTVTCTGTSYYTVQGMKTYNIQRDTINNSLPKLHYSITFIIVPVYTHSMEVTMFTQLKVKIFT